MEGLADRWRTAKRFTSGKESDTRMRRLLDSLGHVPSGIVQNLDPDDPGLVHLLDLGGRAG